MLAKHGDWEELADLEQVRQSHTAHLSRIEVQDFDTVSMEILQKIVSINAELEALSQQEMEVCRQAYAKAKNNKTAINAYSRTSFSTR